MSLRRTTSYHFLALVSMGGRFLVPSVLTREEGKMDTGGPYLNAALLCEKVLQEKDGVLSVIRVIDRVTVMAVSSGVPAPDSLPPSIVSFSMVVILKSGLYKGTMPIKLSINSPSGTLVGESSVDVFFEGDDRGINLISPSQFQVREDGLYWVDVACGPQLLTRVPLRVIYQRMNQGSLKWPPDPQS
jgi:hypothetical protein